MERWKVHYEQKRGHVLVLEGNPPFTRGECDEFRLRMLQNCDVPGLLRLDTAEVDGCLSFRYSLAGTRMLSQAMRPEKWSMSDFLGALSRLAEVMEDCRLYVLDDEQIALSDDLIFVGDGWQDLRFVYVPFNGEPGTAKERLRDLIVRWMMQVTDLDGAVMQQVLRTAASPDFKPSMLRRLTRQVSADIFGGGFPGNPSGSQAKRFSGQTPADVPYVQETNQPAGAMPEPAASPAWRWFAPPQPEPYSLSGLLGDDSAVYEGKGVYKDESSPPDPTRMRVWLLCAAAGLTAMAWKWGYGVQGSTSGFILPAGLTLAAWSGLFVVWKRFSPRPSAEEIEKSSGAEVSMAAAFAGFPVPAEEPRHQMPARLAPPTGVLDWASDRTEQLDRNQKDAIQNYPACFLEWENGSAVRRIPLDLPSFVIGRSKEASRHVDDTLGISRAHAELLRTADGWTAKDLGSRNGSKLNDMPMVPYESYPLRADDCLDLAGSIYRFKAASFVLR